MKTITHVVRNLSIFLLIIIATGVVPTGLVAIVWLFTIKGFDLVFTLHHPGFIFASSIAVALGFIMACVDANQNR